MGNSSRIAEKYRGEFEQLDAHTGGRLGQTLNSLIEIRMLDLQASIRHAKRMHRLIDDFKTKVDVTKKRGTTFGGVFRDQSLVETL